MADFGDTSSYLKPSLPVSPLDIAGKIGGLQQQQNTLQQQQLNISQAKLDQANQGFTYLTRAMTSLGPNATKDQYKAIGAKAAELGLVPPNMVHIWDTQVDEAPDSPTFFKRTLGAVADHQQQLQLQTGVASSLSNGATDYQGKTDVVSGAFTPATQSNIQPPPTQPNVNNDRLLSNGQPNPKYLQPGIVGSSGPPGITPALPVGAAPSVPVPQARPQALPAVRPSAPAVSGPTGPTVQTGHDFTQRFAGEPIATGAPPGVASAIEKVGAQSGVDYATDLNRAKNFQADLYPAQRALEGIKELGPNNVGPGTEALNNVKSAIITWLPDVDKKLVDNVGTFEQTRKYLTQIARSSGNTGTNDQLASAFEANPSIKMSSAATENVLKSVIALRKMQHAQTLLFGQSNLPPSEYSKWISQNQNTLDPRAFGFDMMDSKAQNKLIESLKKDKKGYQKFETSLQFAHDAGLIEPPDRK